METKTNTQTPQAKTPHVVIQAPEPVERRTIGTILRAKFLDGVEKSTFRQLFIEVLEWFAILIATALAIYPNGTADAAQAIFEFWNYALPKFLVFAILIKYRKEIRRAFRKLKWKAAGNQSMLCGLPKKEIVHFLFETGGFKLEDAKKTFGISRKNFDQLAKALEAQGVLVRGANNARVLNEEEFSRQEIYDMLLKAEKVSLLSRMFRLYQGGERRHEKVSKEDIDKEVDAAIEEEEFYEDEEEEIIVEEKSPFKIRPLTH